jgi:hypothetical protein
MPTVSVPPLIGALAFAGAAALAGVAADEFAGAACGAAGAHAASSEVPAAVEAPSITSCSKRRRETACDPARCMGTSLKRGVPRGLGQCMVQRDHIIIIGAPLRDTMPGECLN